MQEVNSGSTAATLDSDYSIDKDLITSFQENGHILLRQVATPAIMEEYRPLIQQAAYRYNTESRPLSERTTYGKAFLQIVNLWEKDEAVRRFVMARRFAKIAADLMGVEGVRIYHDQALFKEPQGGPTPWHQDHHYWPVATDKFVTMWMPLSDVTVEMGPMTFANGSHKLGYLGKVEISDESQHIFQDFIARNRLSLEVGTAMNAGDATFHAGWTLHGTPANTTGRPREAMTIIYFEDGALIAEPDNLNQSNDLKRWLPDLNPGDLAASVLNPLVYSRT